MMEIVDIMSDLDWGTDGKKMSQLVKEILEKIKLEIRNRKNLTQKKVARKIGVSASEFSKILNEDRPFKVNQLIKIAHILNMKVEDLIPGPKRIDVEKMSMLDVIRAIVKQEIKNYLKEG